MWRRLTVAMLLRCRLMPATLVLDVRDLSSDPRPRGRSAGPALAERRGHLLLPLWLSPRGEPMADQHPVWCRAGE